MGGIVAKGIPANANFENLDDLYETAPRNEMLRAIQASSLDPNSQCFLLQDLVRRMQLYQHFDSGEVIILVDSQLSEKTPGVMDPTEWVQVYLNNQNEEQLSQMTTRVAVAVASPVPVSTPFSAAGEEGGPGKSNASGAGHAGRNVSGSNRGMVEGESVSGGGNFNEFALSVQKLERSNKSVSPRGGDAKRSSEPQFDNNVAYFYKDAQMNREHEPFVYLSTSSRQSSGKGRGKGIGKKEAVAVTAPGGPSAVSSCADSKVPDDDRGIRHGAVYYNDEEIEKIAADAVADDKLASPSVLVVDTPEASDYLQTVAAARRKEECPHCMHVINIRHTIDKISPESQSSSRQVLMTTTPEGFAAHKRACGFSMNVMPRFAQVNSSLHVNLADLNKKNEISMQWALMKAIRAFEKKNSLNNEVLQLVKKVIDLGIDDEYSNYMNFNDFGGRSGSSPRFTPREQHVVIDDYGLGERIVEVGKELHSLLLSLRSLETELRMSLRDEEGTPSSSYGGVRSRHQVRDGDSDDDDVEGTTIESHRGSHRSHADGRESTGSIGPSSPGNRSHNSGVGSGVTNASRKQYPHTNNSISFLEEVSHYIRIIEKLLTQLNVKKSILRQHQSVTLGIRDFEFIRMVGKGSFSSVYLVRNRNNNKSYALKCISKSLLEHSKNNNSTVDPITQLLNEQHILIMTTKYNHEPFANLKGAFQTPKFCCFVSDYYRGGDCLSLLANCGHLPERVVKVLAAEVVSAVCWLHSYGVIHRDIKPDNLCITSTGHIKLGDFGQCTRLKKETRKKKLMAGLDFRSSDAKDSDTLSGSGQISNVSGGGSSDIPSVAPFSNKLWAAMDLDMSDIADEWMRLSYRDDKKEQSGSSNPALSDGDYGSSGATPRGVSRTNSDTSSTSIYYQRSEGNSHLHFTNVGNSHYQSPECVCGIGYDHSEDWWAVGVLIFHLLAGITPFENIDGSTSDAEEKDNIVLANILWGNVPSKNVLSADCKDFLRSMLRENKQDRLYYIKSEMAGVMEHRFFDEINFGSLMRGQGPLKLDDETKAGGDVAYLRPDIDEEGACRLPVLWSQPDGHTSVLTASQSKTDQFARFTTINNF